MDFLRLHLVRTIDRTDVLCIACNNFHAELQFTDTRGQGLEFGVHKNCIATIHARRTPSGSSTED